MLTLSYKSQLLISVTHKVELFTNSFEETHFEHVFPDLILLNILITMSHNQLS